MCSLGGCGGTVGAHHLEEAPGGGGAETPGHALAPLMRWYRVAKKALWNDVHEARADFPHADPVGKFTVFNIKKNEDRLITVVHSNRFKIYVRAVLTHDEYDNGKWKDD